MAPSVISPGGPRRDRGVAEVNICSGITIGIDLSDFGDSVGDDSHDACVLEEDVLENEPRGEGVRDLDSS